MDRIGVILLTSFRKSIKKLFPEAEIEALIDFLANQPEKGDVIPGTGGLRKLRWKVTGKGKRGGSRVIYYYHRPEWQLLLLTAYAKNEKADLSAKEKKVLSDMVRQVIEG